METMGQLPEENDIFFGKNTDTPQESEPTSERPAPKSKEELAREIARNMALNMNDDDDDFSFPANHFSALNNGTDPDYDEKADEPEVQREIPQKAERTAVRVKEREYDDSDEYASAPKKTSKKKKKKKKSHAVDIVCGVMALVLVAGVAGVYTYGKKAYDGVFLAGTTINGIEVGGKSKEEALAKLSAVTSFKDKISITKKDGSKVDIDLATLDLKNNINNAVDQVYDSQNHNMWFKALFNPTSYEFDPDSSFNETKLNAVIKKNVIESQNVLESRNAYVEQNDDGSFTVVKEVVGDTIDSNKIDSIYTYIADELSKGNYDISIAGLDVYEKPSILAADLQDQVDRLNSITSIELTFDFIYEKTTLKGSRFIDWLDFDDDGTYTVDESEVVKYVAELAAKYNTYQTDRTFKSTNRGTITVPAGEGIYGWWIDDDGMAELVTEMIEAGRSDEAEALFYHDPYSSFVYEGDPDSWTAKSDIGKTYLELDLSAQHMWYYEKGKMVWETDVVTGLPTASRNTPGGVYKLWFKAKDYRLKDSNADGSSWDTKVAYWNNISFNGIGIHDATWQPYFGGDLYKWNGSHGCVNVSYAAAQYVYENVPLNTPVVAYWS